MTTLSPVEITDEWTLVYDAQASGVFTGTVNTNTGEPVAIWIGESSPVDGTAGVVIGRTQAVALSAANADKLYAKAYDGSASIILDGGTAPDALPPSAFTSDIEGIGRLRVDQGQTSFFQGRQFRTYKELTLPASGGTFLIKIVTTTNIVLYDASIDVHVGDVRLRTYVGGSPSGTFVTGPTVFNRNRMIGTPEYTSGTTLTQAAGGTLTGGIEINTARAKAAGATAQGETVPSRQSGELGADPNTYYWLLTNTDNVIAQLDFKAFWEERPLPGGLNPDTLITANTEMGDFNGN